MPYRRDTLFVTAPDGTRIAYHTHAGRARENEGAPPLAARPPVLLTNGISTTENFWRFLVEDLEQDHRVVHWDYRGHGASDLSPSDDYALRAHVDDLERVTERMMAQGEGRAPHHVAFSMGVRVVLELYRRRPELVPSVSLVAGSPSTPEVPIPQATLSRTLRTLSPLVGPVAPLVHAFLGSPLSYPFGRATGLLRPRAPREDIHEFMSGLRRMDPRAFWMMMRGLVDAPSSWDMLRSLRVPTQIIAARDDLFVPLREMLRMHEELPGADWLLVEDAGHAGLLEAGAEITARVRAFLRTHDTSAARASAPGIS
jgi:pimeloyl-ACP methyl ester carboxylesterase